MVLLCKHNGIKGRELNVNRSNKAGRITAGATVRPADEEGKKNERKWSYDHNSIVNE